jgi:hypothetical protein
MVAKAVARAAGRGSKRVKNMSERMSNEMGKSKSTPTQRAFGGGRKQGLKKGRKEGAVVGAAAGVITASSIAGMTLMEMRSRLKEEQRRADTAESAKERAQAEANAAKLDAAITKAIAESMDTGMKGNNTRGTSPRPRLRDEEVDVSPRAERNERKEVGMAKGGKVKKYNKGGYANCGASMKPTQKSTKMAYGGMARKK